MSQQETPVTAERKSCVALPTDFEEQGMLNSVLIVGFSVENA